MPILALLAEADAGRAAGMPTPGRLSLMCQRPVVTKTGASANNWGWDAIVAKVMDPQHSARRPGRPSARDCRVRCRGWQPTTQRETAGQKLSKVDQGRRARVLAGELLREVDRGS